jgi:hypothetical protein
VKRSETPGYDVTMSRSRVAATQSTWRWSCRIPTRSFCFTLSIQQRIAGWQDGYGAFTVSHRDKDSLIEYIKGQVEHHRRETFLDEYRRVLTENGIVFDERYLA